MSPAAPTHSSSRLARLIWLGLGLICVGLAIIGALLPLMPSTVFLIMAAGCFARSSTKLENWLLNHPKFGPVLRAWRSDHAIPKSAKWIACVSMTGSFIIILLTARSKPWIVVAAGLFLFACSAWIVSRPSRAKAA